MRSRSRALGRKWYPRRLQCSKGTHLLSKSTNLLFLLLSFAYGSVNQSFLCYELMMSLKLSQAFCDLEPIYTYEGTYEVNALVTGREVTGIASIKPPVSSRNKRS